MADSSENPVFEFALAYQKTAALIAAVKLDIFTKIGAGTTSLEDLASRTESSVRGLRILCDYLTVIGLLEKQHSNYLLSQISKTFLDESSPLAAGHGLYGIEVAKVAPEALVTAVDWEQVLRVTRANAVEAGVVDRFRMMAGNALDMDWGSDYDLVLLPNFLHHFDFDVCTALLRKVKASLSASGQAWAIDLVPNEDRISPPIPAMFAFWMLATTPGGDAYTIRELDEMARNAGFRGATTRALAPTPESLIVFES